MENAANIVISQKDVTDIVKSIVSNTAQTSKIIEASVKSIVAITDKYKIDAKAKDIKNISKLIMSYNTMVVDVVNMLTNDIPGGEKLSELIGRVHEVETNSEGKAVKVIKYTGIESLLQIGKVIDSTFGLVTKMCNFKGGIKAIMSFRANMFLMKSIIKDVFTDMITLFTDIVTKNDINKLLKSLVKQPDTITKIDLSKKTGEHTIENDIMEENKQGQLGLLDVVEKTFSIVGMLNNFKLPNLIKLKIQMVKLKFMLSMVITDLVSWSRNHIGKNTMSGINQLSDLILGTKDSKGVRSGGISGIVQSLMQVFILLPRLKLNPVTFVMVRFSIMMLDNIIQLAADTINKKLSLIGDSGLTTIISNSITVLNMFGNVITALTKIGVMSTLIYIFQKPLLWVFSLLLKIVDKIKNVTDEIKKQDITANCFDPILTLIDAIYTIMWKMSIATLLVVPSIVGMVAILVFVFTLSIFIVAFNWVSKLLSEVSESATKNIMKVEQLIVSLLLVGVSILLLALATPIFIFALQGNILPFLGVLVVSVLLLWVLLFIAAKFSQKASGDAINLAINVLIIVGSLVICAIAVLMLALISKVFIDDPWLILGVVGLIVGIIVISGICVGLGIALSFAAPYIAWAAAGIAPLVGLLALVLLAGLSIAGMGKLKLDFGKYTAPKGKDPIGSGNGILGNVGKIFDFASFISDRAKKIGVLEIQGMRKAKRFMRQVNKTVNQIKKIAVSLNSISKLELNEDTILTKTGAIFAFITKLQTHIDNMLYGENASTTKKVLSTMLDFTIIGKIKNKVQANKDKKAQQRLNNVSKVTNTLSNIAEALESIQNLNIDEPKITTKVDNIFTFITKLEGHIAKFMAKDIDPESIVDAQKLSKGEWKKANKKLSKVEATIATIQGICDALNTIKDLKIGKKEQDKIVENVKTALGSINRIAAVISGEEESKIDKAKLKAVKTVIDYVKELNEAFTEVGNANPANIEKNIGNYVKFIDKVNTMDVEKVKKTTQMFEKMNRFSTSIKGDFDRLAEALSDKLLPVLEDLKEVMGVLPEKLDTGFQNTAAAVASTNAPATKENITAQVNRENPNLTSDEVNKIVESRISEAAKADANGVAAKLDELISLLRGYGGDVAVVKTL